MYVAADAVTKVKPVELLIFCITLATVSPGVNVTVTAALKFATPFVDVVNPSVILNVAVEATVAVVATDVIFVVPVAFLRHALNTTN